MWSGGEKGDPTPVYLHGHCRFVNYRGGTSLLYGLSDQWRVYAGAKASFAPAYRLISRSLLQHGASYE